LPDISTSWPNFPACQVQPDLLLVIVQRTSIH
jgi:hypothetical protein